MPRRKPNAAELAERERKILLTAADIIHNTGYSRLNVDNLAKAASMSKSTLYQQFTSKEAIVEKALKVGLDAIHAILDADAAAIEKLSNTLRFLLNFFRSGDSQLAALIYTEALIAFNDHKEIMESLASIVEKIRSTAQEAIDSGQIHPVNKPDVIATAILSGAPVAFMTVHVYGRERSQEALDELHEIWERSMTLEVDERANLDVANISTPDAAG